MKTPIVDFVRRYAASGTSRLHMPGHKGCGPLGCEQWDITEIQGADELYEAEGVIAESEANATDYQKLMELDAQKQTLNTQLEALYAAWEALCD